MKLIALFNKVVIVLGVFSSFVGVVGLLSYVVIFAQRIKLTLSDSLFALLLLAFFLINTILDSSEFLLLIETMRFYFGFFIFYIIFKKWDGLNLRLLFIALIILIPVEAVLINTWIPAQLMPNFPDDIIKASSHFAADGDYQRPYSFSGNASVSSSLLVVIMSFFAVSIRYNFLTLFMLIIFQSGSGFFSYLLYLLYVLRKSIFFFPVLLILILVVFLVMTYIQADKFSYEYVNLLILFKSQQLVDYYSGFSVLNILFGNLAVFTDVGYGGDFGWLYLTLGYGLISMIAIVAFSLTKMNKNNRLPLILLLFSTLHYPVIFFLPGQILFGYFLAQSLTSKNGIC